MTNEQDKQHLQELAAYRFTVENLRARVAELEAKLAAAPQAVQAAVPDGWMLVPMNGTEEMARAFRAESTPELFYMTTIQCADFQERYRAMLNAAPVAPAHPAEGLPAQAIRDAVIQHLTSAGVLEHDGCGIFIASGNASELIDACVTLAATQSTKATP